jgi:hypothetical protein
MKRTQVIITILVAVASMGVGFFAGMKYQQGRRVANFERIGTNGPIGNFRGQSPQEGNFQPVSGEIIAKDESSLTVKLQDGSSKIVLVGSSTLINKAEVGTEADLKEGEKVLVIGQTNSDGSVTAQSIQLNPPMR